MIIKGVVKEIFAVHCIGNTNKRSVLVEYETSLLPQNLFITFVNGKLQLIETVRAGCLVEVDITMKSMVSHGTYRTDVYAESFTLLKQPDNIYDIELDKDDYKSIND